MINAEVEIMNLVGLFFREEKKNIPLSLESSFCASRV